jgi:hypothetical protein
MLKKRHLFDFIIVPITVAAALLIAGLTVQASAQGLPEVWRGEARVCDAGLTQCDYFYAPNTFSSRQECVTEMVARTNLLNAQVQRRYPQAGLRTQWQCVQLPQV